MTQNVCLYVQAEIHSTLYDRVNRFCLDKLKSRSRLVVEAISFYIGISVPDEKRNGFLLSRKMGSLKPNKSDRYKIDAKLPNEKFLNAFESFCSKNGKSETFVINKALVVYLRENDY